MKLQIASDLHIEFLERRWGTDPTLPYAEGADLLILAGDIHKAERALQLFADWPVPVVYVHGNHEFYHGQITTVGDKLRASAGAGMHYLECDEWVYHGVRFLGCCLWTDYLLYGDKESAMREAAATLTDHQLIAAHERLFTPDDARAIHLPSRAWLERKLAEPFAGKTVVVTHHGVHPNSIAEAFQGNPLNPAFVSDLTPLMGKAEMWIHGHVHTSFDYQVNGTRIVTNPRGYPLNRRTANNLTEVRYENERFQPLLVIEV